MAKGGGQREGGALKTALVVTGGLVLAWITVESAFKPFLDRLRAALSRSTDPARDPDEEPAAVHDEDKAATSASAAVAAAVAEEKETSPAAAEPSAPLLPLEEGNQKNGEDTKVALEKGE